MAFPLPRIRAILLTPRTEWSVIADDTTPAAAIWTGYVIPLAALSALAGLVGGVVFGTPFDSLVGEAIGVRLGMRYYVQTAVGGFVGSLVGVALLSWLAGVLAPTFGARCEGTTGLKLAAYSWTAGWIAGLFAILPVLSPLAILGLYSIYLLYLGLKALTGVPEDKAIGYTLALFVTAVVVMFLFGWVSNRMY